MPEILVELIPDTTKLKSGLQQLVDNETISKEMAALFLDAGKQIDAVVNKFSKLGEPILKVFKPSVDKAKTTLQEFAKSGNKDLATMKKSVDGLVKSFIDGLELGLGEALKEAGLSMEEFTKLLKGTDDDIDKLETSLRGMITQLTQMKLRGEENTEQYKKLQAEAVRYRDAIDKVNVSIRKQASDTRQLDIALEFITGLTAAFTVIQGVAALAGEENEDLQKAILKVNSAMSILIGLQQIQNLLKRESNILQVIENNQKKLAITITNLETAATSKNVIVKGAAVVAQRALNLVMSANPALLLVTAFAALAGALAFFTRESDKATESVEQFNAKLDIQNGKIDNNIANIEKQGRLLIGLARAAGKTEEEIAKIQASIFSDVGEELNKSLTETTGTIDTLVGSLNKVVEKNKEVNVQAGAIKTSFAGLFGQVREVEEKTLDISLEKFVKDAEKGVDNIDKVNNLLNQIKLIKVDDAFKKAAENTTTLVQKIEDGLKTLQTRFTQSDENAERATEQRIERQIAERQKLLEDEVARQKRLLLASEQFSEEELKIKKNLLQAELALALNNEKLTFNQRKLLREQAAKESEELDKQFALREFENQVARQKRLLLQSLKGSDEELAQRKELLRAELQLALQNDKLTTEQRKLLIRQYFEEVKTLEREFRSEQKKRVLEDELSIINTRLAALKLSFEEREALTVEALEIQRDLELEAVVNNETKRKEIIAKFDKEIIEQRRRIREEAFKQEQEDFERETFIRRQRLEQEAQTPLPDREDDTSGFQKAQDEVFAKRRQAIADLSVFELQKITERRLHNQEMLKDGLIDFEQYSKNAIDINNDEFVAKRKTEEQYTAVTKEQAALRRQIFEENLDFIVEQTNRVIDSLSNFLQTMANAEKARIDTHKANLVRLREGNAITEKEFLARMKTVERVEKETQRRQAEREKSLALFEAFINGAAAIIKAAPDPFRIAITATLVAAQLAAIATRPIPKFSKGTKHAPKGFAEVGETGAELIKTDSGYYIAEHPQLVWFKGGEKVYTPTETAAIMETPQANTTIINNSNVNSLDKSFDLDKMAKKIGEELVKHPRNIINIDEDGFSVHTISRNNITKYLNKRFTFND